MYVMVFYVPQSHLEEVKEAVFNAGAGTMGPYDRCCFQTLGTGQWRPLSGSTPFLGQVGTLEQVPEWRLELVVDEEHAAQAVQALLDSHPYEVPAYHLIPVLTLEGVEYNE
ncbi:GTP cyclohydrolase 1 type 2 [bioreactor metagenome]|uniref:GTP cyclohydrolase 1 type 2 n=1 Tax=bioreactor metagenome TaxID=1076179 RepID=A0A645E7S4_9ZZZZ